MDNFLPLNRELQKHWIYKDSNYLHCWLELLFNARFAVEPKTDIYKGVVYTINRGEFIYSRPTYSQRLNMTEGKLRSFMNLLLKEGMIKEVRSLGKNKPTIFKICNYDLYNSQPSQSVGNAKVDANNSQATTKSQPSDNQVTTTKEEGKKEKKEKKVFKPPTFDELKSYILKMDYKVDAQYFFNYYTNLDWYNTQGKKMANWQNTLMSWHNKEMSKLSKQININRKAVDF